jgi:hypothetical protein
MFREKRKHKQQEWRNEYSKLIFLKHQLDGSFTSKCDYQSYLKD